MTSFNPRSDIPSLSGKVFVITGGTAGLGKGTITTLAQHDPAVIIFTGRNQQAADSITEAVRKSAPNVKIIFSICDVSSFASVEKSARSILEHIDRLDVLMLNAGIMAVDNKVSVDGYELQFATNHLGHALLVRRLLPLLQKTAEQHGEARVLNLASSAHTMAPSDGIQFSTLKSPQASLGGFPFPSKWCCYGQSKLAQIYYNQQLALRHPDILSIPIHPGVIRTGLLDNLDLFGKILFTFLKSTPIEQGHWHQCWAATCPKAKLKNGEYIEPIGIAGKGTKKTKDAGLSKKLWEWTEEELDAWDAKQTAA